MDDDDEITRRWDETGISPGVETSVTQITSQNGEVITEVVTEIETVTEVTVEEVFEQNESDLEKIRAARVVIVQATALVNAAKHLVNVTTGPIETQPEERQSNLVDHARSELARLDLDQDDIDGLIRVIRAFADMGLSGGGAAWFIPTIQELLTFQNLTPLTDDPSEWIQPGEHVWQSTRCPEALSTDGGRTFYLLSERTLRQQSGLDGDIMHDTQRIYRTEDHAGESNAQ